MYGPPVDDMSDELIVQVSTLVVVRSVIWEVDEFVAIVVTRLVVIVRGRLGARPDAVDGLEELEGFKLDATEVGVLDTDSEDGPVEEEAPFELWQVVSASCYVRGLAFTLT